MTNKICEPHFIVKKEIPVMIQVRFRKLFIGGIDTRLNEDDLKAYFAKFGLITACTIHRDRETGRSRGFGFITFDDPAGVDAVQENRPHVLNGCEVTLKRAVPKELFQEFDGLLTVNRIFVGGLKQETQDSDLREYFGTFGKVRKIDVMVDRNTNTKRGFAFVEYDDYDPVDKVVLQGNHTIQGNEVTVKKAKSRLEMELLRQRTNIHPDGIPSFLRRRSIPVPDHRAFGDTFGAFARNSVDSFVDCPFHFGNRRRRFL